MHEDKTLMDADATLLPKNLYIIELHVMGTLQVRGLKQMLPGRFDRFLEGHPFALAASARPAL